MKQRIITAIFALIIFIPFILIGGLPFIIFTYFLATIGLAELMRMREIKIASFPALLAFISLWLTLLPESINITKYTMFSKAEIVMLFVFVLLIYTVLVKNKFTFDDAGFILLATIYVSMGFLYFIESRVSVNGLHTIFFVLFIVWATDTGAYFAGRALGKNKLWPEISPNKTIEGAIGGILLAMLVAFLYHTIYPFQHPILVLLGTTVLVSIFGQLGDLVESAFKRHYNVKDSGKILPGHGGILDRLDSLLFVFPMLHFIHFI